MGEVFITRRGGSGSFSVKLPKFSYDGNHSLIEDGNGNWRLKLYDTGNLVFTEHPGVLEVFLVGGGGGGAYKSSTNRGNGGGGGGYTITSMVAADSIVVNESYLATIGDGGAANTDGGITSIFGISAAGGHTGIGGSDKEAVGGAGGSGGGGGVASSGANDYGGNGGSDGEDGTQAYRSATSLYGPGGEGQGFTTREFGTLVTKAYIVGTVPAAVDWLSDSEGGTALVPNKDVIYSVMTTGDYWYKDYIWNGLSYEQTDIAQVYAGGGGGNGQDTYGLGGAGGGGDGVGTKKPSADSGDPNTGGGGGAGGSTAAATGSGGSGIIVIRNYRG